MKLQLKLKQKQQQQHVSYSQVIRVIYLSVAKYFIFFTYLHQKHVKVSRYS